MQFEDCDPWREFDGENIFDELVSRLKFSVALPLLRTGSHVEVYICRDEINLKVGRFYQLDLGMPVPIKKSTASCRFLADRRSLELIVDRKKKKEDIENSGQSDNRPDELDESVQTCQKPLKSTGLQIDNELLDEIF